MKTRGVSRLELIELRRLFIRWRETFLILIEVSDVDDLRYGQLVLASGATH